jgi:sucrose phosphorylase
MKNQVQLIAYADRLGGGGLREFAALLAGPLAGLFGAVHLLPFYDAIDGTDAGFDPRDHLRVDPRLGQWADVRALAGQLDVMADVIVNHISSDSPQFRDFIARGDASPYAGLFLSPAAVFGREPTEADVRAIYRPRPGRPFTHFTLAGGEQRLLWTTFTAQQVDIDTAHPQGRAYLSAILHALAAHGVRLVRLDAVGYAIKKPGTSCFMIPETFAFIDAFAAEARALGLEVLVEVHAHHRRQIEIAHKVDWVYDFALPPLVLHAIFFRTARYLRQWISQRPINAMTVLDTHDGIGIIDIGPEGSGSEGHAGLVPAAEVAQLVERIHANSGDQSREATGAAASNLDLYQVNCTFYDALGRDDARYLMARAIQFFLPGVPQVYYVGLLAGENDMALLRRTGVGRDINRHHYRAAEVAQALDKPVVRALCDLIRRRNTHPAFAGRFSLDADVDDGRLRMRWTNGAHVAELDVDFVAGHHDVRFSGA